MRNNPSLFRLFGIRVGFHYSWFIAFIIGITVVATQFPEVYPLGERLLVGLIASLLLPIAALIRGLFLIFLATSKGVSVKRINLFIFGGVLEYNNEKTSPGFERLITVAGLVTNFAIAILFYGANLILIVRNGNALAIGIMQWLAYTYIFISLFHFVPGFPLDGGRAFRLLLWSVTHDYDGATGIAGWVGWVIGWAAVAGGILLVTIGEAWFLGVLVAFLGWVLQGAATLSRRYAVIRKGLQEFTAHDILNKECGQVPPELTLFQLVRDYALTTGQRSFAVVDGGKMLGLLTLQRIKKVPRRRWKSTPVSKILSSPSALELAQAKQSVASLLEQMDELRTNELTVLDKDEVIGFVTRDSINNLVKTRAELGLKRWYR